MPADDAKTTKAAAAAATEEVKKDLEADLTALRAELEALAADVTELGRLQVERAKDRATGLANLGEDMMENLDDTVTTSVRAHPLRSLAMAFGAGYLFALLSRR